MPKQNAHLPLEAVSERDVDLLLLEELHVSQRFAQWFVSRVFSADVTGDLHLARHSVSDATGESDLEVVFVDAGGRRLGVLLENKVTAVAQPEQGERYRQRANAGKIAGAWDDARTCIIAPQKYLDASTDAAKYDARISYEKVATWFDTIAANDARAAYRRDFVLAGIEQARRGYKAVRDEATTLFCHSYWEDVSRLFPELRFEEPGDRPSQSTWIEFRPEGLGPRRIFHKMRAGVVDLAIEADAARAAGLASAWKAFLTGDTVVEMTGKSLAIRVTVPTLETRGDYAGQVNAARQGMKAAFRLLHLSPLLVLPA
jgi:hypothetical protein